MIPLRSLNKVRLVKIGYLVTNPAPLVCAVAQWACAIYPSRTQAAALAVGHDTDACLRFTAEVDYPRLVRMTAKACIS
jgi:hypothetical protein